MLPKYWNITALLVLLCGYRLLAQNCNNLVENGRLQVAIPAGEGTGQTINETYYNCLTYAQNPNFYLYAGVTIYFGDAVNNPTSYVRVVFRCSGTVWGIFAGMSSPAIAITGNEVFGPNSFERENCSSCSLPPTGDEYLCVPCNESCLGDTSLNRCYGTASSQCCNFLFNETCVVSCPTNTQANSSHICVCENSWEGPLCDQCLIPCGNGTPNSDCSGCNCNVGYEGQICETNTDDCQSSPCLNNGSCTDMINNYTCTCVNEWEGRNCSECGLGCVNGRDNSDCSQCICDLGFTGTMCEADIDECMPNPCNNSGSCNNLVNNYTCNCTNEWEGRNCSECGLGCDNGRDNSECSQCICDLGFTGTMCETDIDECMPNPCNNSGSCNNLVNNYTCNCTNEWEGRNCSECGLGCDNGRDNSDCSQCICDLGFTGTMCEADIDECMPNPCNNSGSCNNLVNNYTCNCTNEWEGRNCSECGLGCDNGRDNSECSQCICDLGFTGTMCETDIDECMPNPCNNSGSCNNLVNNYTCNCTNEWEGRNCSECGLGCGNGKDNSECSQCICDLGFTGTMCETDINECMSNPCNNSGSCNDLVNNYTCNCTNNWEGRNCSECGLGCGNGRDNSECSMCVCDPGFTGILCEVDINECETNPCRNNGTCINLVNDYSCNCTNNWTGRNCSICPLNCNNGTQSLDCSICTCDAGYSGDSCETNINECSPNPCENEGNCIDGINNFSCNCANLWMGRTCNTCLLTCVNGNQSSDCSECECFQGYTGTNCSMDINECLPNPCLNSGTCTDMINDYACNCTNEWGGRNCSACGLGCGINGIENSDCSNCDCNLGFTGTMCGTNINDCTPNSPCRNNGSCTDLVDNYMCNCTNEWEGRNCSECGLGCFNGRDNSECSMCVCDPGFTGRLCDTDINECQPSPCRNSGSCTDLVNNYTCNCTDGWEGRNCSTPIDPCVPNPCRHGGECEKNGTSFVCICPLGYSGRECGIASITCNVSESNCNSGVCVEVPRFDLIEAIPPSYCECTSSYTGINCDLLINRCTPEACQNGGSCELVKNLEYNLNYTCTCLDPWSGPNCQLCPFDGLCENNGSRSADCSRCICQSPYIGLYCAETSCTESQVVDVDKCSDECSTPNYQVSSGNICSACGIDNCLKCEKDQNVCTKCQNGYQVIDKECMRIQAGCGIDNCVRCYYGICTICAANYSVTFENECVSFERPIDVTTKGNFNTLPIIIGSVSGGIALLLIILLILVGSAIAIYYYKKNYGDLVYTVEKDDFKVDIEINNPIYIGGDDLDQQKLLKSL